MISRRTDRSDRTAEASHRSVSSGLAVSDRSAASHRSATCSRYTSSTTRSDTMRSDMSSARSIRTDGMSIEDLELKKVQIEKQVSLSIFMS